MHFTTLAMGALAFTGAAVAVEMAVNEELAASKYSLLLLLQKFYFFPLITKKHVFCI